MATTTRQRSTTSLPTSAGSLAPNYLKGLQPTAHHLIRTQPMVQKQGFRTAKLVWSPSSPIKSTHSVPHTRFWTARRWENPPWEMLTRRLRRHRPNIQTRQRLLGRGPYSLGTLLRTIIRGIYLLLPRIQKSCMRMVTASLVYRFQPLPPLLYLVHLLSPCHKVVMSPLF